MCRWLAYRGEPLQPSILILDAQHSLVAQSLNSPLGAETVNGDGFGFGWYPADAEAGGIPAMFHSIEPAWHDQNLREITRAVRSPLFFSHVRAAGGPPIQQTNCHPFRYENWLFMHNGFLADFAQGQARPDLRDRPGAVPARARHDRLGGAVPPRAHVRAARRPGGGDDRDGAAGRVRRARARRAVPDAGDDRGLGRRDPLDLPLLDAGPLALAVPLGRHPDASASCTRMPSGSSLFGDDAHVVVSEPLNDLPGTFVEVPEATVAILDPDGYRHQPFMA